MPVGIARNYEEHERLLLVVQRLLHPGVGQHNAGLPAYPYAVVIPRNELRRLFTSARGDETIGKNLIEGCVPGFVHPSVQGHMRTAHRVTPRKR